MCSAMKGGLDTGGSRDGRRRKVRWRFDGGLRKERSNGCRRERKELRSRTKKGNGMSLPKKGEPLDSGRLKGAPPKRLDLARKRKKKELKELKGQLANRYAQQRKEACNTTTDLSVPRLVSQQVQDNSARYIPQYRIENRRGGAANT